MFPRRLLEELHCPYCGSDLEVAAALEGDDERLRHAIVRCACHRYPLLDGILVLRQCSPLEPPGIDRAAALLDRQRPQDAVRAALDVPRWRRSDRLFARLARTVPGLGALHARWAASRLRPLLEGSLDFASAVSMLRRPSYADYLIHRFANPSFLAAIPLLCLLEGIDRYAPPDARRRVLDLGCGVGQSSALLRWLFPAWEVVSLDQDFTNLFLGRRHLRGDGIYLCADAERPLPLADARFDAVHCLDAFHYVQSKVALVAEVDRVVRREGVWLFPHLHNALQDNPAAGIPLAPDDYRRLFAAVRGRLLPEAQVLRDFTANRPLRLAAPDDAAAIRSAPALSFVGCRREDFWRDRADVDQVLLRCAPGLAINPLYLPTANGTSVRLRARWPNPDLERECAAGGDVPPAEASLEQTLLDRLRGGQAIDADAGEVRRLLRSFVLVPQLVQS